VGTKPPYAAAESYNEYMRRAFITLSIALTLFVGVVTPVYAAANFPILDPNFSIVPSQCNACPCNYYAVLQLLQNLMNAGVAMGIIAFIVVIVYAGASFMLNPTNPESRSRAKSMLLNVVIGMLIVLTAWLVVDFIMKIVYNPSAIVAGSDAFGPWNEILSSNDDKWCIEPEDASPIGGILGGLAGLTLGGNGPGGSVRGGSGGSGVTSGGICTTRTTGPCSVANLQGAFGSTAAAEAASKICSAESCNGSCLQGDKTTQGYPVSFGLFQINITAHKVNGLDCPKAFDSLFTGSHKNVQIVNQRLYQECKAAALDPSYNAAVAARIYKGDGGSFRQWSTRAKCGLTFVSPHRLAIADCAPVD
jgi:hypothetical protein